MFGECHAHIIMDGANYKKAIALHADGVKEEWIHTCFAEYKRRGISFVRDGGDALGVSERAKAIAPAYGIDYRSPIFAIHKAGHYGSIVGRSFFDLKEYELLVKEAIERGADFIKIMTTGLLDFVNHGKITGTPLEKSEVKEMVKIAHAYGMAVMSHTNGSYGVQAALEAGVDSIEHGNYMDEESLELLAESETVWVPTLVPVRNLRGCGRYEESVLSPVIERAERNLCLAFQKGVKTALGSDAGAYMVAHGDGIQNEYDAFRNILGESEEIDSWLLEGERLIREKFRRS